METWDALFDGCLVSWMDSRHHHLGRKVETEVIEKWENPLREYGVCLFQVVILVAILVLVTEMSCVFLQNLDPYFVFVQ